MQHVRFLFLAAVAGVAGCTSISVEPTCPEELQVGESGEVKANAVNPGAIPTYQWQVIPAGMGTLEAPDEATTMFTASTEGQVTLRLTASDGIFQVQSQCRTRVVGVALEVALDFVPAEPAAGEEVTLTCSEQTGVAARFEIVQTDGDSVELTETAPGVVVFTPQSAGTFGFECTGETAGGAGSMPAGVTVTVVADDGGGRGGRGGSRR